MNGCQGCWDAPGTVARAAGRSGSIGLVFEVVLALGVDLVRVSYGWGQEGGGWGSNDVGVDVTGEVDGGLNWAPDRSGEVTGDSAGLVASHSGCGRRRRRKRCRGRSSDAPLAETVDPPARGVVSFA